MAKSIERIPTKPGLTTRQWIAIAVGLVVLAALAFAACQTGDEPPIRVRNGSMDVILTQDTWQGNGDAWSPSKGKNSGTFMVKVETANGHTCGQAGPTGSGKEVWILYSDKVEFTFKTEGRLSGETKVRPKDKLKKVSDVLLRHGDTGDGGYILAVGVKGGPTPWGCTFTSGNHLSVINICPASSSACQ